MKFEVFSSHGNRVPHKRYDIENGYPYVVGVRGRDLRADGRARIRTRDGARRVARRGEQGARRGRGEQPGAGIFKAELRDDISENGKTKLMDETVLVSLQLRHDRLTLSVGRRILNIDVGLRSRVRGGVRSRRSGGRGRFRRGPGGRRPRERRAAADPRPRRPLASLRALSRAAANPAGPRRSPPADSKSAATNQRTVCVAYLYEY
ncbi:unnamed protein product, partial [Brenthis ino]